MSTSLGGTSGITFNDSTNLTAANVSGKLSPYVTNTSNVMTVRRRTVVDGSGTALGTYVGVLTPNRSLKGSLTVDSYITSINLRTWALANGWNGTSAAIVYIDSSAIILGTNTATPALTIDGSWPNGITVYNYGSIIGRGGAGGGSGYVVGNAGGPAISLGVACTIYNYGYIAGGGGGGAGGSYGGGGGGAGGGAGGASPGGAGGAGGAFGVLGAAGLLSGQNGVAGSAASGKTTITSCGGGGGGLQLPGSGGIYTGSAGIGGGAGGSGGNGSSNAAGNGAGQANAGGAAGSTNDGGGGGGYGAAGGANGQAGGAGGKCINLNGYACTRYGTGFYWGAIS